MKEEGRCGRTEEEEEQKLNIKMRIRERRRMGIRIGIGMEERIEEHVECDSKYDYCRSS